MIRPAIADDAPGIAAVHVASWCETYTGLIPDDYIAERSYETRLQLWNAILAKPHFAFVYEAEGKVVGFAQAGKAMEAQPDYPGELYSLYLLKAYHGQGIGKQLFDSSVAALAEHRLLPFTTWVLASNPALAFYSKMGGRIIAERFESLPDVVLRDVQLGWK